MEFRYPTWPIVDLNTDQGPEQAFKDWAEGTALAEQEPHSWVIQIPDSTECRYVDRCLAEIEHLLRSLDDYTTGH